MYYNKCIIVIIIVITIFFKYSLFNHNNSNNKRWFRFSFFESEVKVKWHMAKYGNLYSEFVLCN